MVSIITPSFNSEAFIHETYKSILAQTSSDWEWIIVDDGSTDNTLKILKDYTTSNAKIKFYERDRLPKGACSCRNIAINYANGEYLIFLDTDDILSENCIYQRQFLIEQNPLLDFIVFQMLQFNITKDDLRLLWNIENNQDHLERAIKMNPIMAGSSTIWKKESFIKIGLWDEKLLINQDIELHIRAITKHLKYKIRLDLPPDLFVRNNQFSISRAKKKSFEKQASRVYYFEIICMHLINSNLIEKYRGSLEWLCLKLFSDLLVDKEGILANEIIQIGIQKKILQNPIKKIAAFSLSFLSKNRINAMSLIRYFLRLSNKIIGEDKTLGKEIYDGKIM
jgi:glycosyltransferase involved in cell wall biosynthesis